MDCIEANGMEQSARREDVSGIIDRARRATEQRDWLEARRCWDAVRESSPHHIPAYLGAGHALREAGLYDEAELALGAGAERFPDDEQIAIARASLANARRDWPTALSRWEIVRSRFPENPWSYLGNVQALRGSGRSDQAGPLLVSAENALAAAKQRGLDAVTALRAEFEIARARMDWPSVRQSAEKIIARETAPSAQVFLALAQAHWHLGDADQADLAALRAVSADPSLVDALLVRVWVATGRGDGETALACYRALVKLNPTAVRWSLKLVQLLNWLGRVREAASELENIRGRWPNDPVVAAFLLNYGPAAEQLQPVAGKAPAKAEHARPLLVADPDFAKAEEVVAIAEKAPGPEEWLRPLVVADPERDVLLAEFRDERRGCHAVAAVRPLPGDDESHNHLSQGFQTIAVPTGYRIAQRRPPGYNRGPTQYAGSPRSETPLHDWQLRRRFCRHPLWRGARRGSHSRVRGPYLQLAPSSVEDRGRPKIHAESPGSERPPRQDGS
jgi:tetratricopeptide (TPR) repeat protein